MMKAFLLIVCVELIGILAYSQTHELNQQKYWSYKARLQDEFMYYDLFNLYATGSHLPTDRRNNSDEIMDWRDGTLHLATYIQVLATEYSLLKYYGFSTDDTEWDLFRAIEALFRLDMNGEKYFRNPEEYVDGDINGFFIRDDIDDNFFKNYYPFVEGTYKDWDIESDLMKNIKYDNNIDCGEDDCEHWMEMSKDQCWHLYLGLALVSKLLDGVEICAGDECYNFVDRIKGITHNIQYQLSGREDQWVIWELYNPVDGHEVPEGRGGKIWNFAYGFGIAASEIVGYDLHAKSSHSDLARKAFMLTWRWNDWDADDYDTRALATVGDVRYYDDFSRLYSEYFDKNLYSYPHFPLIHLILYPDLYGEKERIFANSIIQGIKDRLDEAPMEGPNCGAVDFWSSPNTVVWPEKRKECKSGDEFNGLDYMLLHNLYYLARKESLNMNSQDFPLINIYREYGTHYRPLVICGEMTSYDKVLEEDINLKLISNSSITLEPGFHVKYGAYFNALIDPYSLNPSNMKSKHGLAKEELLLQVIESSKYPIDDNHEIVRKNSVKQKMKNHTENEYKDSNKIGNDLIERINLEVFPNPSCGNFILNVLYPKSDEVYSVNVFNCLGQLVLSVEGKSNAKTRIDLSKYPKGMYLIKVHINGKILTENIILQ